jgi:hypothetical protein
MKRLAFAVLVVGLMGCQKAGDTKLDLPTVQGGVTTDAPVTPASQGSYIYCYPDHGHGPAKWIHVQDNSPENKLCFVDGVCFYGC